MRGSSSHPTHKSVMFFNPQHGCRLVNKYWAHGWSPLNVWVDWCSIPDLFAVFGQDLSHPANQKAGSCHDHNNIAFHGWVKWFGLSLNESKCRTNSFISARFLQLGNCQSFKPGQVSAVRDSARVISCARQWEPRNSNQTKWHRTNIFHNEHENRFMKFHKFQDFLLNLLHFLKVARKSKPYWKSKGLGPKLHIHGALLLIGLLVEKQLLTFQNPNRLQCRMRTTLRWNHQRNWEDCHAFFSCKHLNGTRSLKLEN